MQNPKVGDIIQNYKSLKALLTPKNVTNIFSRMDINNDNEISLLEWLTFCEEELEKLEGEQTAITEGKKMSSTRTMSVTYIYHYMIYVKLL